MYKRQAKALEDGADEIESVINLNHLKDHKYNLIHEELKQLRELLGDKTLKVIVEMQTIDDSEKASIAKVLEENKVDFIKTSTGFIAPDNIYSKDVYKRQDNLICELIFTIIKIYCPIIPNIINSSSPICRITARSITHTINTNIYFS